MKKKYIVLLMILLIAAGIIIGVAAVMTSLEKNLNQLSSLPVTDVDLTEIKDGTYTGSYEVFPVAAEVRVTVSNHAITAIELIKHTNDQGQPAEIIPEKVVEAQSLQVDAVSGATYSSKVILKAIEDALVNAGK